MNLLDKSILCPRCGQFMNRPAQVDLIVHDDQKILLLKKDPKSLVNLSSEHFWGKPLTKMLGSSIYKDGWHVLPGAIVRKELTLEETVCSCSQNLLGVECTINYLIGIYDKPNRDPKSAGVSFCFAVTPKSKKFKINKDQIAGINFYAEGSIPSDVPLDHPKMISDFLEGKSLPLLKELQFPDYKIRPIGLIPNNLCCPHCGQYNNRPVQTDGILFLDGKLIMIKRKREYLPPEYAEKFPQIYRQDTFNNGYLTGWYVLPGGYVRRESTIEETVIKEYFEETGIKTKPKRIVSIYSGLDRDAKSNGLSVCFELEYVSGKFKKGTEVEEIQKFDPDNLPSPIAFDHLEMIQDFLKFTQVG